MSCLRRAPDSNADPRAQGSPATCRPASRPVGGPAQTGYFGHGPVGSWPVPRQGHPRRPATPGTLDDRPDRRDRPDRQPPRRRPSHAHPRDSLRRDRGRRGRAEPPHGAQVALGTDPAGAGPPLPSSTGVSNAPPPTPPPGPTVLGATVTFYGRGYGHGVGMSQYGARGRALAGQLRAGDPRPLLPRHDARHGCRDDADPRPRAARLRRRPPPAPLPIVRPAAAVVHRWHRGDVPGRCASLTAHARPRAGTATTWRPAGDRAGRRASCATGEAGHRRASGRPTRDQPPAHLEGLGLRPVPRRPASAASAATPTVTVVNELPLERYLRGVVPAEMPSTWPAEALKAQAIAARSYAARTAPAGRLVYDVYDDTRSQVYRGAHGEKADDERRDRRDAPASCSSGGRRRQHAVPLDRRRRDREQRERLRLVDRREGRRRRQLPARLAGPAPDGTVVRRGVAVRDVEDADVHARAAVGLVRGRPADERRHAHGARPARPRRVGPADQRHADRLAGTKTVSGDVFRSVFNAGRPAADPMMRSTLFGPRRSPDAG